MKLQVLLISFFFFMNLHAKNLGVFGEAFEIEEKDLLEYMQERLLQMQQDGSLEAENNKIKEKILNNVKTPPAVSGIKHTEIERTFEYDPTIELTRNLADHKGQVFAKKGDRFNPLDTVTLSKPLLFIDGDDENQIQWAVSKLNKNNFSKVILVKGSPLDLQKKSGGDVRHGGNACLNRDIYFDQYGLITTKLGIKHVPAIVFQKEMEKVLTINEEVADAEEKK